MTQQDSRPAIIYCRFSPRPSEEECDSNAKQQERVRAFCIARGWKIDGEYQDAAKSGKSLKGRLGLENATQHACRVHGVLVVYDLSRLSRDALDTGLIVRRLKRHGAELASVIDNVDLTTPGGRLTFGILGLLNQHVREVAAARTSSAMLSHQKKGRRMGRADRVPYGMRSVADKGMEPEPSEMAAIARIRELGAAGESSRAICRILDDEGIPRRGGKRWSGAQKLVLTILGRK